MAKISAEYRLKRLFMANRKTLKIVKLEAGFYPI